MKRCTTRMAASRWTQMAILVAVTGAAVAVWSTRASAPTFATADQSFAEVIYDLDRHLQEEHGDSCGEIATSHPDGDFGAHGLATDADLPAKVTALLVGADVGPLSAFEVKRIDAKGILLLSEDATSEVLSGGRTVLGKALQFSYLTGGTEGSTRWELTEEASFYACPQFE